MDNSVRTDYATHTKLMQTNTKSKRTRFRGFFCFTSLALRGTAYLSCVWPLAAFRHAEIKHVTSFEILEGHADERIRVEEECVLDPAPFDEAGVPLPKLDYFSDFHI